MELVGEGWPLETQRTGLVHGSRQQRWLEPGTVVLANELVTEQAGEGVAGREGEAARGDPESLVRGIDRWFSLAERRAVRRGPEAHLQQRQVQDAMSHLPPHGVQFPPGTPAAGNRMRCLPWRIQNLCSSRLCLGALSPLGIKQANQIFF